MFHNVSGYNEENNVYYRVVQGVNISSQDWKELVLHVIRKGTLKHVATRITVDGSASVGAASYLFLRTLPDIPTR